MLPPARPLRRPPPARGPGSPAAHAPTGGHPARRGPTPCIGTLARPVYHRRLAGWRCPPPRPAGLPTCGRPAGAGLARCGPCTARRAGAPDRDTPGPPAATTGADLPGQGPWCGDGLTAPGQPPLAAAPKSLVTYSANV